MRRAFLLAALALPAAAQVPDAGPDSAFHGIVGVSATGGSYGTGAAWERLGAGAGFLDLDHRDWGGLTLRGSQAAILAPDGGRARERTATASGRLYFDLGEDGGRLRLTLDGLRNGFRPDPGSTQGSALKGSTVRGSGLRLGWSSDRDPVKAGAAVDLAFFRSRYHSGLVVDQYGPTVGFGLRGNREWISLGADWAVLANPALPGWEQREVAGRLAWTHYFAPGSGAGAVLKPASFTLAGQVGRRPYAVDLDTGVVLDLDDVQDRKATAGLTWRGRSGWGLSLEAGAARFAAATPSGAQFQGGGPTYTARIATLSLHFTW